MKPPRPLVASILCLAALAPGDESPEPGLWSRGRAPDGWHVVEADRLQVQSRLPRATTDALVEHLTAVGELYDELLATRRLGRRAAVKLFADAHEFAAYGGPDGVVAYTDLRVPEVVAYDAGVVLGERHVPSPARVSSAVVLTDAQRAAIDATLERVADRYLHDVAGSLAHEAWHVHVDEATDGAAIPLWLDEGLADVFAASWRGEGPPRLSPERTNARRLRRLQRAVVERDVVPIAELLALDPRRFERDGGLAYAMSWGLVHFLLHHDDEVLSSIPRAILTDLAAGADPEPAVGTAFDGVDLGRLDREWQVWIRRRPTDDPLADLARSHGDVLRASDLLAPDDWTDTYAWFLSRR